MKLETGDVLLLPTEHSGVYQWFAEKLGENVAELIKNIEHNRYIHAEIYVGYGHVLGAWMSGVKLIKLSPAVLDYYSKFHIYRPLLLEEQRKQIENEWQKYFNKPYDYISLAQNAIIEVLSLGLEPLEKYFESLALYENPNAMICSEVVARILEDVGYVIEPRPEFVTPDDLADKLIRIV